MQFIDLAAQQARIKPQIDANIQKVLSHGQYILGPEVAELEDKLKAYLRRETLHQRRQRHRRVANRPDGFGT